MIPIRYIGSKFEWFPLRLKGTVFTAGGLEFVARVSDERIIFKEFYMGPRGARNSGDLP